MIASLLAAPAAAATVTLHAAHMYPEDHPWQRGFERFAEVLKSTPGSDLELAIHPRGSWGGENDYVHSLRQGLLDLAVIPPSVPNSVSKNLAFFDIMFLWRDPDHWRRVMDGPVGERMAEIIETGTSQPGVPGLKVLGFWGGTKRHLLSRTRTYATLADLAGLRVGVQDNAMNLEIWRGLGVAPVAIPLRNSNALLEADIVECVEAELGNAVALKLIDVAPYVTLTAHAITVRPLVLSEATWRRLSPAQQTVMIKAAAAATATVRQLELKQDDEVAQVLRNAGVHVADFSGRADLYARTEDVRRRAAQESGLERLLRAIEDEAGTPPH
jgi:TRAP-type C4-dicarboxylate transport system substrate-binding protein